jgi:hypothetical protein
MNIFTNIKSLFTLLVLLILLTISPTLLYAQATCPGGPSSGTFKANQPHTAVFCQDAVDIIDGVRGIFVKNGVTQTVMLTNVVKGTTVYGDGMVLYTATIPAMPKGNYTFTVTVLSGTLESSPSNPFVLSAIDLLAPSNLFVR